RIMTRHLLFALGLSLTLGVVATLADDKKDDKKPADKAAADKTPVSYAGRSLQAWLDDLHDADPLVREEAIEVLGLLGPAAKAATPELKKLLESKDQALRTRSALALWKVAGEAKPAVAVLAKSLSGAEPAVRREALIALGQMGPAAGPAAP